MSPLQPDRGQLTLDFLIGISVLLLTIAFVFTMTPSLFTPFDHSQPSSPLVSDRTADHLSQAVLVESGSGEELDPAATIDFFEEDDESLADDLQLQESTRVNVSIVEMGSNDVVDYDGQTLSRGPPTPRDSGQVTLSQRAVVLDEDIYWLHVKVW